MREDGYGLFRQLLREGESTYHLDGRDYHLYWFGERTDAGNGLRVICQETGEERRFRYGYSSEAVWNLLATLDSDRWDTPIGEWVSPDKWVD